MEWLCIDVDHLCTSGVAEHRWRQGVTASKVDPSKSMAGVDASMHRLSMAGQSTFRALAIDRLPGQAVDSRSMGFDASTAVSMCMCPCACVLADLAYTALPHPCLAIKESTKGADVDASKSMATGSMAVDCLG